MIKKPDNQFGFLFPSKSMVASLLNQTTPLKKPNVYVRLYNSVLRADLFLSMS